MDQRHLQEFRTVTKNKSMSAEALALLGAEASPGGSPVFAVVRRERRARSRAPIVWIVSLVLMTLMALPAFFPGAFVKHALLSLGGSEIAPAGKKALQAPRVERLGRGA
jgi:hypothetical protein